MRQQVDSSRLRGAPARMPAAVAGSIALLLGAAPAPAMAIESAADHHRSPGTPTSASPAAAATPRVPTAASPATYTVQPGDTVFGIAARYGLRTADVLALNGLTSSSIIRPGEVLRLIGAAPAAPTPPAPVAEAGTYTVQPGDTLSAIAGRHGVTVQSLFAANGLGSESIIYPGQKIALKVAPAPAATPAPKPIPTLDAEQRANAQLIIRVGRELGVPEQGLAIALGAAMQESSLRNLPAGDRDSIGLFQQRPSAGWGSVEEVGDPERSSRAFFGGPYDPNGWSTRGLLDIPGWQSLSFTQAAQAVQISAHPDLYAQWEPAALSWLASLG